MIPEMSVLRINSNMLYRFEYAARVAGIFVIAVGAFVLLGWAIDLASLSSLLPRLAPVDANTAMAFALGGSSLLFSLSGKYNPRKLALAQTCALIVALIGLVTLSEYLFGWNLGIDTVLFGQAASAENTPFPDRMSIATALAFLLLGGALFMPKVPRGYWAAQLLALGVLAFPLLVLLGYAYGVSALYTSSPFFAMALHTALALSALALGILFMNPEHGWMIALANDGASGRVARRLLIPGMVFPFLLGGVRLYAQQTGLFDIAIGIAVVSLFNIMIIGFLIALNAGLLLREETERKRAEAASQRRTDEFAVLYDVTSDLAVQRDLPNLLQVVLDRAVELLHAPAGGIGLYDPVHREIEMTVTKKLPIPVGSRIKLGEGMAGRVAASRQPLIVDDYDDYPYRRREREGVLMGAQVQVPMLYSGDLIGVLGLAELNGSSRKYTENDVRLLSLFASQAASAVHNVRLFQQIQNLNAELEQRVIDRTHQLEQSEETFTKVFRSSPVGMSITGQDRRVIEVNDSYLKMIGYRRKEVVGHTAEELRLTSPEDRAHVSKKMMEKGSLRDYDMKVRTKSGKTIEALLSAEQLELAGSRVTLAIIYDISTRKEAEQAIHKLNADLKIQSQQLQAANQELEAFSYSVSHDLRAPLRAIDGFSRILQEDFASQLEADANHYLALVRRNTMQMGHLVDDLLAFSRLSRQALTKQAVATTKQVRQVLSELSQSHADRKINVTIGELPDCYGDPALLKQAWVNLISNAIKFTRMRNPAQIEVGCLPRSSHGYGDDGESITYFVKDNGAGYDMRYADKLFGVFQRLHRAEEFEGTGVGLAIVQRIISRHGGRVWAEGEIDKGATFYFSLPVEKISESAPKELIDPLVERAKELV